MHKHFYLFFGLMFYFLFVLDGITNDIYRLANFLKAVGYWSYEKSVKVGGVAYKFQSLHTDAIHRR